MLKQPIRLKIIPELKQKDLLSQNIVLGCPFVKFAPELGLSSTEVLLGWQ